MTDYRELASNLENAQGVLKRLEQTEIALAIVNDSLATKNENISFFQHNITIKVGDIQIDSVSRKNNLVLEALREKLQDDVSIYKNMLKMMNVNINNEAS